MNEQALLQRSVNQDGGAAKHIRPLSHLWPQKTKMAEPNVLLTNRSGNEKLNEHTVLAANCTDAAKNRCNESKPAGSHELLHGCFQSC